MIEKSSRTWQCKVDLDWITFRNNVDKARTSTDEVFNGRELHDDEVITNIDIVNP